MGRYLVCSMTLIVCHLIEIAVIVYSALASAKRLKSEDEITQALNSLLDISSQKHYLCEVCFSVIMEILEPLSAPALSELVNSVGKLREVLCVKIEESRLEAFQLALWIWKRLGSQKDVEVEGFIFMSEKYNSDFIFDENFLKKLQTPLLHGTYCHPRVHSIWYDLLGMIIPGFKSGLSWESKLGKTRSEKRTKHLQVFWTIMVEEGLLQSSLERRYLAFGLLRMLLPFLLPEEYPIVLSKPMITCLRNNLKKENNYLHASAKKSVGYIAFLLKKDIFSAESKSVLMISLKQFKKYIDITDINWDTLEGEKSSLGTFSILKDMFYSSLDSIQGNLELDGSVIKRQQEILNEICNLCKSPQIKEEEAASILKFLLLHALFRMKAGVKGSVRSFPVECKEAIDKKAHLPFPLHKFFFDCVVNVLSSLLQRPTFTVKAKGDKHSPYVSLIESLFKFKDSIESLAHFEHSRQYSGDAVEALQSLNETRNSIKKKLIKCKEADSPQFKKLNSLFLFTSHLIFVQLDEIGSGFLGHATDISVIVERAFSVGKKRGKGNSGADDEPLWNDVLLDLMLSVLSLPNQLVRKSVHGLLTSFDADITDDGLKTFLEVLHEQDADEEEEEEEEEEEDDEDDDDDDDDDQDDEEEEEVHNDDETENSIMEIDAEAKLDIDKMNLDDDGDDDASDEDLDDDAMFKLDSIIAAQFQLRREQNKKRKKEEMIHFKFRVLALLEDYIKSSAKSSKIPLLCEYLLHSITVNTVEEKLEPRIMKSLLKIVNKGISKCNVESTQIEEINVEQICNTFIKSVNILVHLLPKRREIAPAIECICFYLLKVLKQLTDLHNDLETQRKVCEILGMSLQRYFTHQKSIVLKRKFYLKCFEIMPNFGIESIGILAENAKSARKDYLKCESTELLASIFTPGTCRTDDLREDLQLTCQRSEKALGELLSSILSTAIVESKYFLASLRCISRIASQGIQMKIKIWKADDIDNFINKLEKLKSNKHAIQSCAKSLKETMTMSLKSSPVSVESKAKRTTKAQKDSRKKTKKTKTIQ